MADNNHLTSMDVIDWADYLLGGLTPSGLTAFAAEHDRIHTHLQTCPECRARTTLGIMAATVDDDEIAAAAAPYSHKEPPDIRQVLPFLVRNEDQAT